MKKRLTKAPVLAYPDFTRPFLLYAEASGVGIGAVLAQKDDSDVKHVISYASGTLRNYEGNYGVTDLELLAIVWSLGHYRLYLLGTHVTIITDDKANHWILEKKKPALSLGGRQTRWAVLLVLLVSVIYKPRQKHSNADALSRAPIIKPRPQDALFDFNPAEWAKQDEERTADMGLQVRPPTEVKNVATPLEAVKEAITEEVQAECTAIEIYSLPTITDEAMRERQMADPFLFDLIGYNEDGTDRENILLIVSIEMVAQYYTIRNGVLYHVVKERGRKRPVCQ